MHPARSGKQPVYRKTPVPFAPAAADVDHRHVACGHASEVLGHAYLSWQRLQKRGS